MFELKAKKLRPSARLPEAAHSGDLGCDLFSANECVIPAGGQLKVGTGIALEFPGEWGGIIKDRSSMASGGIYTSGGVIDGGYRGEIIVLLRNASGSDYRVKAGDKIAQIVPLKAPEWHIIEVEKLGNTSREAGGFGSTGK